MLPKTGGEVMTSILTELRTINTSISDTVNGMLILVILLAAMAYGLTAQEAIEAAKVV